MAKMANNRDPVTQMSFKLECILGHSQALLQTTLGWGFEVMVHHHSIYLIEFIEILAILTPFRDFTDPNTFVKVCM